MSRDLCLKPMAFVAFTMVLFGLLLLPTRAHVTLTSDNGGAQDMSRLLSTVFTNYSSSVPPTHNRSTPLDVKIGLAIMAVVNLDTRSQVLHLRGYLRVSWVDFSLGWDPAQYGNITYIIVPQRDVWTPDIIMGNSLLENVYIGSEETRLSVDHRGLVSWQPFFASNFQCQVDVTRYPMDKNVCPIIINSWMYDNSFLKLSALEQHTKLERSVPVSNGQFIIESAEPEHIVIKYDDLDYDFICFRIRMLRRPSYTFLSMLLPMFVIGLLNVISFMIPSDSSEKVSLSLNILLATAVFIGVVHDDLPDRSDTISSVAMYVIFLLVLSFLGVLGNTLVLLLHQHDQHDHNDPTETPRSYSCQRYSPDYHDNSNSLIGSEQSHDRQQSHAKLLNTLNTDKEIVYSVVTPKTSDQSECMRQETLSAHVSVVGVKSRAARLNRFLLIASAISLLGCTFAVLMLIWN